MLHVYVGSSKPDLISQRNIQMQQSAREFLRHFRHLAMPY